MAGIRLRFEVDGRTTQVPIEWLWRTKVVNVGGQTEAYVGSANETEASILCREAGTYEIQLAPLPGYLPLEPITVEVPDRDFVERVVQLTAE